MTPRRMFLLGFALVLVVLLPIYLATLQTIPNGAEHYYMIDVGETQIVLNTWGTLHATGYPLYVMSGNLLVGLFRLLGVSPAVAPALVSLFWMFIALALIYALALHRLNHPSITELPAHSENLAGNWKLETDNSPDTSHIAHSTLLAAAMTILFGLTRTVWIHASIAEIYSFGLTILALLLLMALWRGEIRGRVYWLALIGGVGAFHHRALLMAAPALLYAVWPELTRQPRKLPRVLMVALLLGLLGFLPYLYLPLRANAGAAWVYGEPGTWGGFWDQFLGREASRFIGPPGSWDGLVANFNLVNTVLITDLTAPGLVLGLLGLLIGIRRHRRAAITLLISAGTAYLFHIALYTDILSALILPITLSLAFGWLFLADWAFCVGTRYIVPLRLGGIALMMAFSVYLVTANLPFIRDLTTDTTGLETITLAEGAPPGSTLMLDWGPRHFAVGFTRDVLGGLQDITLVDHKADFPAIVASGQLVTPDFTFYNRPVSWWETTLGQKVYLNAAAPHLVAIRTRPELSPTPLSETVAPVEVSLACTLDSINLWVAWGAGERPEHDLSVLVHLLDSAGNVIAQGDQAAPVYGWRPLTTWEAGEIVRDVYPLPRLPDGVNIRYGLYRQAAGGEFINEVVDETRVECGE